MTDRRESLGRREKDGHIEALFDEVAKRNEALERYDAAVTELREKFNKYANMTTTKG